MQNLSLVLLASLSLGACTPRMKPAGYVSGTILAVTGAAGLGIYAGRCSSSQDGYEFLFKCVPAAPIGAAGMLMGVIGLGTLLVTALSPSAPKVLDAPAAVSPDAPDVSSARFLEPAGPWPAPSRSPSAPAGAPLAFTSSLSLRPAAGGSSLMSFH